MMNRVRRIGKFVICENKNNYMDVNINNKIVVLYLKV